MEMQLFLLFLATGAQTAATRQQSIRHSVYIVSTGGCNSEASVYNAINAKPCLPTQREISRNTAARCGHLSTHFVCIMCRGGIVGGLSPDLALLARVHRCSWSAGELFGELVWVGQRSSDPEHRQTVRVAHDRHPAVLWSAVRTPHLQDKIR